VTTVTDRPAVPKRPVRPTRCMYVAPSTPQGRTLTLEVKLENSLSCYNFKRWNADAFNTRFNTGF
jgi:hypothetical protein